MADKYTVTLTGLTLAEASEACGAVALARFDAQCTCDYAVGHLCPWCRRMFGPGADDELFPRLVSELTEWFFDRHAKKEGG